MSKLYNSGKGPDGPRQPDATKKKRVRDALTNVDYNNPWWNAEPGKVWQKLLSHVSNIEMYQTSTFSKTAQLKYLYAPNSHGPFYGTAIANGNANLGQVTENVIARCVDTCAATISSQEIRARFLTDGAEWSTKRRARHLETYSNGLAKLLRKNQVECEAFKDAAITGSGFVYPWVDPFGAIRIDRVQLEDILVDDYDVRHGQLPRKLHLRQIVPLDEAIAMYPDKAVLLNSARGASSFNQRRLWQAYRDVRADEVVLCTAWYLPIGVKGKPGYKAGRYVVCCANGDICDEKYERKVYPIKWMHWSSPPQGFYGIGLAERIAGHQRQLNNYGRWGDMLIKRHAAPTTYVKLSDSNLTVNSKHPLGAVAAYKTTPPITVIPQAISPDLLRRVQDLRITSYQEAGVSEMNAHATKQPGIDSGVAVREMRDIASERFAMQEKNFERLQLDVFLELLYCCKSLGADAPAIPRKGRWGTNLISWSDVEIDEAAVQIEAAAATGKTAAGRLSLMSELAQSGVISQDEARELLLSPDTDYVVSMHTATFEHVDHLIENALDGEPIAMDPYANLQVCVWRGTQKLQLAEDDGAYEEILDGLRQWVDECANQIASAQAPQTSTAPVPQIGAGPPGQDMSGAPIAGAGVQLATAAA